MTAAVFAAPGVLELQRRPVPTPGPGEVLITVEGCGLCGTDLHILSDPPGHPATPGTILGHEIIGRVVALGAGVPASTEGLRVAVDANLRCGRCRACRRGKQNHCENWTTLGIFRDGGFGRYVVAPDTALHPVADTLPLREAIWTELLSCVIGSTDRLAVQPGQLAVVIGAGPAGMLHALMLQAAGARVIVAEQAPYRLELARKAGIGTVVNVGETSLAEVVAEASDGWGADAVVDAVGSQLPLCLEIAATGGTVSLFGMNAAAAPATAQNLVTRKELTLFGSYVGYHTFPRAIAVLEASAIAPGSLITHELALEQLPEGIAAARRGEAMKVLVRPD